MSPSSESLSPRKKIIADLALEKYAEELDRDGYTIVPPEVTGVSAKQLEMLSGVKPAQFQLMQLCTLDRAFRNLAINPVAVALMRYLIHPVMQQAVADAISVECPQGSLIAFHGQLWHGAYPRKLPGLRLTLGNYYRHEMISPQDDIPNHFPQELADDCDNPRIFRKLAGFGNPYQTQILPVPKALRATSP